MDNLVASAQQAASNAKAAVDTAKQDVAAVRAIGTGLQERTALVRKDPMLNDHGRQQKLAEIHTQEERKAVDLTKQGLARIDAALAGENAWHPERLLRTASFDADPTAHATQGLYLSNVLPRMGTGELRGHFEDAVAKKNFAALAAVRREALYRSQQPNAGDGERALVRDLEQHVGTKLGTPEQTLGPVWPAPLMRLHGHFAELKGLRGRLESAFTGVSRFKHAA